MDWFLVVPPLLGFTVVQAIWPSPKAIAYRVVIIVIAIICVIATILRTVGLV